MSCDSCGLKEHCGLEVCTCKCFWCITNLRNLPECIYCYSNHQIPQDNCSCGCILCSICEGICKCSESDSCICGDGPDVCKGCGITHHCMGQNCDTYIRKNLICDCTQRNIPMCICQFKRYPPRCVVAS